MTKLEIYHVLTLFAATFATQAFAENLQDSEQALIDAKRAYAHAVLDGGPMSSAQINQLYQETVTPAQSHLEQTMSSSWRDVLNQRNLAASRSDPSKFPGSDWLSKRANGGNPTAPSHVDLSIPQAAPQESSRPASAQVVLDGNGIPKFLEFPGKKTTTPSTTIPPGPEK